MRDRWLRASRRLDAQQEDATVQAAGPAAVAVLGGHPMLVSELIRALDSGVVFPGERKAIEFLRGLRWRRRQRGVAARGSVAPRVRIPKAVP